MLGSEEADTLMAHLPPVTWQDVATKHDLRTLGPEFRAEMADLRTDLRSEMADLRTEFVALRGDVRADMAELRGETRAEMRGLRGDMAAMESNVRSEIDRAVTKQTWRLTTFVAAWCALLVTVVGIIR